MPVQRIDPKVIFASIAPAIDKPPVFSDKTKGWDVSRANDGRPDPFVDQARIALNLTDEQVDTIWESSLV